MHAASTTFGVIGESGKRLSSHVVETNGQALVEQLKAIAGKKHVCLEEGTQSAWLYEILSPHAESIVVARVSESRGQKNDERDAFALAELLRAGGLKRTVFKETGDDKELGELGRAHGMVVQDVVRVQNRLKARFRSRGVVVSSKSVDSEKGREESLAKLPDATRGATKTLYAHDDAVEAIRRQAEKELVHEARRHPIYRVPESCPGLGPIRVAQPIPIVVSPMHFRTKRQFRSYCGLGIVMCSSSDWVQNKKARLTTRLPCGPTLKKIVGAWESSVLTLRSIEGCANGAPKDKFSVAVAGGSGPNVPSAILAKFTSKRVTSSRPNPRVGA